MRYCLVYHPNHDCMTIHVDRRLTKKMIESWDSEEGFASSDPQPPYIQDMFKVDGVESLSIYPYSLQIMKGTVFSWDEIVTKSLLILQVFFEPEGQMAEAKPEEHHQISPLEREMMGMLTRRLSDLGEDPPE